MRVAEVFDILDALKLPSDDLVVCGSASLFVRGLKREPQDLDIVARNVAWDRALKYGEALSAPFDDVLSVQFRCRDLLIEILNGWFPGELGWSVNYLIHSADLINGYRFMSLEQTLIWKKRLKRDKDLEDIKAIERYLLTQQS